MLERIARVIQKNLIPFVVLSIVFGLFFGWVYPSSTPVLKRLTPVSLFIMLYPMMIGLKIEEITKAAKNLKLILSSSIFNFVISPPLAALLAYVFLRGYPDFAVGLILTGCVPCAGMVAAWTGYAKGNVALSMVIVALSLVISIFTIPVWMSTLAGIYVAVNVMEMFKDILLIVVIPLVLGNLTRRYLIRKSGIQRFMELKVTFPAVSMLGMYMIVFISMAIESARVIHNPAYFVVILAPLVLFYLPIFSASLLYAVKVGFNYADSMAFVYGVAGKNISIAIALATVFFSPLTVLILAIKPIIQISFMGGFLKLTPKIEERMFKVL